MDVDKLWFLDECGVTTGMTRLYGRAFGGDRVYEYVPDCRYETTTILSAVKLSGDTVPVVFGGALNGKTFLTYIENALVPSLEPGDIVIMDCLTSHKVKGVVDAVEKVGAFVLFLPEYSPDLNPIELMWSKIKSVIRSLKPRSPLDLLSAISIAFEAISPLDISAWFRHCGYSIPLPTFSIA